MLVPSKMIYWNTSKFIRKHYSRCGAGLQPGTSPVVSFSKIFSIRNTYFQEHLRVFFIFFFFFFFDCNVSSKNLLSLFLFVSSKNQTPCTFFYKLITFKIVIDKFANRSSCGYCFRRFWKFPREYLQWSSQ